MVICGAVSAQTGAPLEYVETRTADTGNQAAEDQAVRAVLSGSAAQMALAARAARTV